VEVTIVVRGAVPLQQDAHVVLLTDGFIGERYLDIAPGEGALLPPGGTLRGAVGGVEGIVASFSGLGSGLGEMGGALRGLLADMSQEQSIPLTLRSLRHLLEDLRPRLLDLTGTLQDFLVQAQQDIAATGDRAGRTLERLDSAVAENNTALKRLMRELHVNLGEVNKTMLAAQKTLTTTTTALETTQGNTTRLLVTVRDLSENLQRSTAETLAGLQRLLAHADEMIRHNDRNLYHSLESLRDTAENLQAATRQVRTNPSVLLWGNSQPEPEARSAADATTRTLQDRGRVGRYDRLQ